MFFQNARYCNGFPTVRRNSDMLGVSIHSILSDVFSLVPVYSGHKMVTVGADLTSSFRSQSLTAESEAGEEPVKPDRTR